MTLPIDRTRLYVDRCGDGLAPIDLPADEDESGGEMPPYAPGDSVSVFPVSVPGGPSGYVVFRPDDVQDPSTAAPTGVPEPLSLRDAYEDAQDPYRTAIPGQVLPVAVGDEGEIVEAVWVLDDGTSTTIGPVERALRADLGALIVKGRLAGTLVASATALAQAMDRSAPDKISAIGRELREHIKRIEEEAGDDDDTTDHRSNLSTPV